MRIEPAQIVDGKYRIVRLLGEGGMGVVYEAENVRIRRRVALKLLHPHIAERVENITRFEREAQAAGQIGSEHIVEVLDFGQLPEGGHYIVMEFLEGESLSDRIRERGRIAGKELGTIFLHLLSGLGAAHDAGIVHRDLKPDNVFLSRVRGQQGDFVKILDFGISKFDGASAVGNMNMTREGTIMGTPAYMSPEQARGARSDPRSDLYAVGVIMYEAISGQVPFDAQSFNELVFKIALEEPRPIDTVVPQIDPKLAAIVRRAMMRDPAERFQTANDFLTALRNWMSPGALEAAATIRLSGPAPPVPAAAPTLQSAKAAVPNTASAVATDTTATGGGVPAATHWGAVAAAVGISLAFFGGGGWWIVRHVLGGDAPAARMTEPPPVVAAGPSVAALVDAAQSAAPSGTIATPMVSAGASLVPVPVASAGESLPPAPATEHLTGAESKVSAPLGKKGSAPHAGEGAATPAPSASPPSGAPAANPPDDKVPSATPTTPMSTQRKFRETI